MNGLSGGVPGLILSDNAKSYVKCKQFLNSTVDLKMIRLRIVLRLLETTNGDSQEATSKHFRKFIHYTHRDMHVLPSQVKAVLCDRPLTVISNDFRDPLTLTHNPFLFGKTSDDKLSCSYNRHQFIFSHFCN